MVIALSPNEYLVWADRNLFDIRTSLPRFGSVDVFVLHLHSTSGPFHFETIWNHVLKKQQLG